jgi:UDPglucose 6-dehydrogenase
MIKYASNVFLATKISFINEISNICEKLGANVEDVASGMGKDNRIGSQFLNAGIGYGGSCFLKYTNALVQIVGGAEHDFELLKSVIKVNNQQQASLVEKAKERVGSLAGKRIALLGLAFKPNTDDMREAASVAIANELVKER